MSGKTTMIRPAGKGRNPRPRPSPNDDGGEGPPKKPK